MSQNDKEEKKKGTNVFYSDVNKINVDYLLEDFYLVSIFANDYEDDIFANILNEIKMNEKFAETTSKIVNKLPSPAIKFIKKLGLEKLSTFLTYRTIILDTGFSVWDTASVYGGLYAGLIQCAEMDEFLESIIYNSDID